MTLQVGDLIPIGGSGDVKKSEVLEGKTYSSDEGTDLTGTMPNNGVLSKTITTQGGTQKISPGYYEGGEVKAQFNNLISSNIKSGITIGGIKGTLQEQTLHYIQGGPTRHARRYSSESRYVNPVNFEMFLGGEIKYSIEAHVDFDYDYYSTLILYKNGVRIDSVTSYRQTVRKEGSISVKSGDIVRAEYECGLKTEGAGAYISLSYNLSDDPYGKSYED